MRYGIESGDETANGGHSALAGLPIHAVAEPTPTAVS